MTPVALEQKMAFGRVMQKFSAYLRLNSLWVVTQPKTLGALRAPVPVALSGGAQGA